MPDISQEELNELRGARKILTELHSDAAVGTDLKRLMKKKYGDKLSFPELDALDQVKSAEEKLGKVVEEKSTAMEKKLDELIAERKKEKEDAAVGDFETRLNRIVTDRGYTDEGREKLLGIMKDRGIQHVEDAAVIFEAGQPKAATKPRQTSTRFNFVQSDGKDDESFKNLMADPDQWAADEMYRALDELKTD